jgi:uncharacterized protein (DUF58 family)
VTPTPRAAVLLAAIGVAAFVLTPWLSVALALAVAAAVVTDAWSVRGAPRIERTVPMTLSRGAPVPVVVSAAPDGRVVRLRQPPAVSLVVDGGDGAGAVAATITGTRRGRHVLPGVASASLGPLGLARVHHRAGPSVEVRVLPDVAGARRLILRLRRTRAGLASGRRLGPLGLGTEFESVRDYTTDDDFRQLNWRASARLGRPMSNQYRIEQDREVICLVDCGRLMSAPLADSTALDVALDAVTVVALAADELGDRFGAIAFDDAIRRVLTPRHRGGGAAVSSLFDLAARPVDSDFEAAFVRVSRSHRAVVFVFTDLLDETAARSLVAASTVMAGRHATFVATPSDRALRALAADEERPAVALAALDVLSARRQAALTLRRLGVQVLEAPPDRLAERCLDAYLSAKLHARL